MIFINKKTKMLAPIIISLITVLFLLGYLTMLIWAAPSISLIIIGGIVLLALIGVMIAMLAERIKEIRSGEEDDLSKY